MKAVEITYDILKNIRYYWWSIADEANKKITLKQFTEISSEELINKIRQGRTVVMNMVNSIKKDDVKVYLDNGFEVLMLRPTDYGNLRTHYMI